MNAKQGKHDDAVSENTPLDDYDQVRIDPEAIEAELEGREQFEQRPVPEYYPCDVKRAAPVGMTLFNVDSTGNLNVFVPGEVSAEAKIFWFPAPSHGEQISLEGSAGTETVVAIATQRHVRFHEQVYLDPTKREHAFPTKIYSRFLIDFLPL